jgi:ligand-binding SRPBCC domain-containing protein
MRRFDLLISVNAPKEDVYNHIANPHNLMGLQPLLTSIELLPETKNENGEIVRASYSVETFRFLGIPIYNNRIKAVATLTRPPDELEYFVESNPKIEIRFVYQLLQDNNSTQISLRVTILKVSSLLENFVYNEAMKAQRAVLINLKKRLENIQ